MSSGIGMTHKEVLLSVYARKRLLQERRFAHAPLSARAIALNHLKLSEIRSFLLMKLVKCFI